MIQKKTFADQAIEQFVLLYQIHNRALEEKVNIGPLTEDCNL